MGAGGNRNYSEDGIAVTHSQALSKVRPAGALGPVKVFRTEEDLTMSITLWDMTLEMYTLALGGVAPRRDGGRRRDGGLQETGALAWRDGQDLCAPGARCLGLW